VTLTPAPIASAAQLALSPDGRRLAFVAARRRGASQLWIRPLDGVQAQPLPGTAGASFPFWSPDSRSIAFFAGGELKKIDTTGGVPQVLCNLMFSNVRPECEPPFAVLAHRLHSLRTIPGLYNNFLGAQLRLEVTTGAAHCYDGAQEAA
jgi:hypothetical protein